ncbi:hypothetical protein ANN_06631 [Periplaneta americana]|uniref:Uncharacterized protein n=1 Tax=Periplaneta americana TaxID=6978 RepID=A0ABQ8TE84_PERAM|nr:hypothetical protein ANN_06631 [Periplaneta americana]
MARKSEILYDFDIQGFHIQIDGSLTTDKMAELIPSGGGTIVAQEQSSSVASSSSEVKKEIGNTQILEKSSDYQSEEMSRVLKESSHSVSSSSTRVVSSSSSSVSSSVTSQRVSSTSIGVESSQERVKNGVVTIELDGPVLSPNLSFPPHALADNTLDDNGNQVAEVAPVLPPGDPGPQQQIYEAESSQEYFVRQEDGKVVEEHSASSQHESLSGNLPLPSEEPAAPQPVLDAEPPAPEPAEPAKEFEPEPQLTSEIKTEAAVNGSSATEIKQESIKNTLKEIISEIEEAVVSEVISDSSVITNHEVTKEASLDRIIHGHSLAFTHIHVYCLENYPVVLYGCETWTLTLSEKQRLRVFENKVLRKIFGAKRDEVTGEWRKLHNAELHALYSSPDIIRNIKSRHLRWAGHVARMGESRNAYRVLVGRPEGKRPLGRPRRRWEDNIKMDLREVGYDGRDWINLAQDRDQWRAYVRAAMNLRTEITATEQASKSFDKQTSTSTLEEAIVNSNQQVDS